MPGCCPTRATKNPFSPDEKRSDNRARSSHLFPRRCRLGLELAPGRCCSRCNRLPWRRRASPSTTLDEIVDYLSTNADRLIYASGAVKWFFGCRGSVRRFFKVSISWSPQLVPGGNLVGMSLNIPSPGTLLEIPDSPGRAADSSWLSDVWRAGCASPVDMRTAKTNRIRPALLTLSAVVTLGVVLTATAGEPIRFSGDKSKPAPNAPNKFPQERNSTLSSIPSASPLDGLNSPALNSRRMDPKEEKRMKNAKLEKENWMMVDRGDLQNEDAENEGFGIRDYSGETLEKDQKGAGEIWFGNNQDRGGKAGSQGRASGSGGRQVNSARTPSAPQATSRPLDNNIRFGPPGSDFDLTSPVAKGQSKDASFQTLGPSVDANHALKDLFGGPAGARSGPVEPDRGRESFGLRSINSQPAAGGGLGRGYGLNIESPRATPAPSRSMIEGPRNQPGGLSGFGSSPLNSALNSSGSDLNSATRNSATPLNQPRQEYAPTSTRDLFAPPSRPGR